MAKELTRILDDEVVDFLKDNYRIAYNLISQRTEIDGKPIDDRLFNSILLEARKDTGSTKVSKELLGMLINSNRFEAYDPVMDWLQTAYPVSPAFDPNFCPYTMKLVESLNPKDDEYKAYCYHFILRWGVGLIYQSTGLYPNQPNALMPVLIGKQNAGKTSWFRQLLPECLQPYVKEKLANTHEKDTHQEVAENVLIIDDEFSATNKKDAAKMKAELTRGKISQRKVYDRYVTTAPRRASYCATNNEMEVINDPTGNRRIIPIITNQINWDIYNSLDKSLVLAEWVAAYRSGWDFSLKTSDIEMLNKFDEPHRQASQEEEAFLRYFEPVHNMRLTKPMFAGPDDPFDMSTTELVQYLMARMPAIKLNVGNMGRVLAKLGFVKKAGRYTVQLRPEHEVRVIS